MLATDVELQGWLREEIKSVFGVEENLEKWNYEKAFPQLKRCLAIMVSFGLQLCIIFTSAVKNAKQILQFETLRLYALYFISLDTQRSPSNTSTSEEKNIPSHRTLTFISTPPHYTHSFRLKYLEE
jgi:hypothetical protein